MRYYSVISASFLMVLSAYTSSAFSQTQSLAGVETTSALTVNATSPAYLSFIDGQIAPSSAEATWQIAINRTQFQTNSGTSGPGQVGVYSSGVNDFDAVTSCVAPALSIDQILPASGAPGSQAFSGNALLNAWYDYDMTTHSVSSKKLVYLVLDGGSCFKFQILDYNSGVYSVQASALEIPIQAPLVFEQTIDASSSTDTVYLGLEGGQLVPTPLDGSWLVAVKRTQFQTNSGTSGPGLVGVANSGQKDFAAVNSCAGLSFSIDSLLPASGAPGSVPSSGSEVLNAWYNYDMSTHIVTSKQDVYALSDGVQCMKLQILDYESGRFVVKVSQLK